MLLLFILNKRLEVIDTLSNNGEISKVTPFFDDEYKQYLATGAETFQFTTLANTEESQHLVVGNYVAFKYKNKIKMFHITSIEEEHGEDFVKTVYSEMAGIELINEMIRPMSINNANVVKFVNTILAETSWELGMVDLAISDVFDIEITNYTSAYSILQEYLVDKYGAEISFEIKLKGGVVTNKILNIYSKRGKDNGYRFSYSHNVPSIVRTVDSSDLATALIGEGKNGLTFASVEASDKPLNQDFIADEEAYKIWNNNGSHIMGTEKFDTESPHELLKLTRAKLKERCNPKVKYEIKTEILDYDDIEIGDQIYVTDHEFNPPIQLTARISELAISFTDPSKNECVLSNFKEVKSNITKEMKSMASKLEGYVDSQFPISGDKIQDGAISQKQVSKEYHTQIVTDAVYASLVETEDLIAAKADIGELNAVKANVENLTAENATITGELTAVKANIKSLEAENVTITGSLNAANANIQNLEANKASIEDLKATNANIESLTASKADITELTAIKANINELTAGKADIGILDAVKADVEVLNAGYAKIDDLEANKASITDLKATNANVENLTANVANIDKLVANKADITELTAVKANIESLTAKDAEIENLVANKASIDDLNAANANIGTLTASVANIDTLVAKKANIADLNATNANVENLKAGQAEIEVLVAKKASIDDLKATNASITQLQANKADVTDLTAAKGEITQLKSETAKIGTLESNIASIDNLLAGNITADNIATGAITAGSGIIANGAIGDAQISSLDAAKISAGTIDTSKVTVAGPNSNLKMSGNRLQVFTGTGVSQVERVSLGDVNGDGTKYGLLIRGADGKTVIMDENGVTNAGITDGSITNDKVNPNANIDGSKLNINSVVSKINEDGTETIQGTKIEVDGTTLNTKLSNITTKQAEDSEKITQAYSQITANTNAIKLKVDEQTYTTDKKGTESTLSKHTSEINALKDEVAIKVGRTEVTQIVDEVNGELIDSKINTAKAEIKVTTDAISKNVTNLSQTVSNKADGSTVTAINNKVGTLETSVNGISGKVTNLEKTTTDLRTSVAGVKGEVSTLKSNVASLEVTTSGISQKVSSVESTTSTLTNKVDTAQSTANSAKSAASTAQSTANNALSKAESATTEISKTNSKVSSIETDLGKITSRVENVETTSTTTIDLAKAMAGGKVLYTDAMFKKGSNNIGIYNNLANGNVTVTRVAKTSDCPTSSTHCLEVKTTGSASPSFGGIAFGTLSKANRILITRIIAKIPTGRNISWHSNSTGTRSSQKWLTSTSGTGKWEEYICQVKCGDSGTFSSTNFFAIYGGSAPTTESPLIWYIAYATVIDITDNDESINDLTTRMTSAEQKITEDAITNTVKKNFYTKTETEGAITSKGYQTSSQVKQTVDALQLKFSQSGGYNLLRNSKGLNGTLNWISNGGGIATITDTTFKTCFASSFPSGISYAGGENKYYIRLKNDTDYVYEAWIYSRITINGYPTAPLHFWCSTTQGGTDIGQCTIIDYRQSISTANKWTKCYVHFKTKSSGNIWFRPFIYTGGTAADFWVTEISLSESSIENMWSPHPSEIYDGVTTIDKDGVTVTASNVKSKTNMSANGFKITKTDTNEDVFKVNSDGTLAIKGNITVTGGSIPSSNLTGTIDNARLSSTITTGAANGTSAKSTLDSNSTNWTNAFNRVSQWAYGAVSGSTTINGGLIQTNTILADKIAISDFTNYVTLKPNVAAAGGPNGGTWSCYNITSSTLNHARFTNKINNVKSGDRFRINGWIWCATASQGVNFALVMRKSDGTMINSSNIACKVSKASTYEQFSLELITHAIPAEFSYMDIKAFLTSDSCPVWLYGVGIYRMASGELIVDGAITANKISSRTITADKIVSGAITSNEIKAGTITASNIASRTITADRIVSGTITANEIKAGTITSYNIASRTIKADRIVAGAITANELASRTITAEKIATGVITANEIKSGAITTDKLAANAITAGKLSATAIDGMKITGNTIVGASITGGTFNSTNDVFKVLSDGTVQTDFLAVGNEISTELLTVETINNPKYQAVVDQPYTLYISNQVGPNYNGLEDGGWYPSVSDAIAVLPRNLNGYTITFEFKTDITENIVLNKFHSGQICIAFGGFSLNGYLFCYGPSNHFRIYGNKQGSTGGTTRGKIKPLTGYNYAGYNFGLAFQYTQYTVYDIDLYPDVATKTNAGGMTAFHNSLGNVFALKAEGNMRYLCRLYYNSNAYINSSSGSCNNATFTAQQGSKLVLNNTKQAGRNTSGNPYWTSSNGEVVYTGVTWDSTTSSNNNTNTGTGSTVTTTETITPTSADTYRSTYSSWRKQGTVVQGNGWGSGNCDGYWFFGSNLYNILNTGTIKSVTISITRQAGGNSGAVTHTLCGHNYTSKPSGTPSMGSSILTFSAAVGATATIKLTSAQITALKKFKGIGLKSTYSSGYYSVCSGSCTIKVTYTE